MSVVQIHALTEECVTTPLEVTAVFVLIQDIPDQLAQMVSAKIINTFNISGIIT